MMSRVSQTDSEWYTCSSPLHCRRLSDADKDELLSFSDFVVAVHLVNLVLKGVVAALG